MKHVINWNKSSYAHICDGRYEKITNWKKLNSLEKKFKRKKSEFYFQSLSLNKILFLRESVFLCHQQQTQTTLDIKSGKGLAHSHKKSLYILYKRWSQSIWLLNIYDMYYGSVLASTKAELKLFWTSIKLKYYPEHVFCGNCIFNII